MLKNAIKNSIQNKNQPALEDLSLPDGLFGRSREGREAFLCFCDTCTLPREPEGLGLLEMQT
jgi:hypothetical protein